MNRASIERYAKQIYNVLRLDKNFNIQDVVKNLGGTIEEDSLMPGVIAEISDLSCEKQRRSFKIKISDSNLLDSRKRFSIAHELGHLFIHLGFLDDEKWKKCCNDQIVYRRQEYCTGIMEMEANAFAAAFLMPDDIFFDEATNNSNDDGSYNINKIAEDFGVSREAAYYRGINLGIWV